MISSQLEMRDINYSDAEDILHRIYKVLFMKRLAIFDFDGTLFDSVHDVIICFNKALSMNGFPTLTREEYIERLGGNIDEIVSLILKDKNSKENIELIKKDYQKLYDESNKDNTLPFPNSLEVVTSYPIDVGEPV